VSAVAKQLCNTGLEKVAESFTTELEPNEVDEHYETSEDKEIIAQGCN